VTATCNGSKCQVLVGVTVLIRCWVINAYSWPERPGRMGVRPAPGP
jgi:hypothetical protein